MRRVLVPSVVLVSLLSFPALAHHHTTGWIYQCNQPPAAPPPEWLGRVDPHGRSVNTIPSAAVLRVDSAGRETTLVTAYSATFPRGLRAVAADRSSASRPRLMVASQPDWSSGLFYVDSATGAVTTVISSSLSDYGTVIAHRGRNLSTQRLTTGRWTVQLSFPGESGNAYVAVLTARGIRPGVRLADGRRFLINLDVLTLLSWTGRLGSVFRGNLGFLDSLGEARARLDVSSLMPVVRGLRIWVGAFTLNPGAPMGIQTIADPIVLNL